MMSKSNQWFYQQFGVEYGPVRGEELKQLADSGRLLNDDLVRREGMEQWIVAGRIRGLFSSGVDCLT